MSSLDTISNFVALTENLVNITAGVTAGVAEGELLVDAWQKVDEAMAETVVSISHVARMITSALKLEDFVQQELGKALKYPWYKDDQLTFPGATEENGVIVLDHPEDMVTMAVVKIGALEQRIAELEQEKLNMAVNLSGGH